MASKRKCLNCKEYADKDAGILAPVGFFCSTKCASSYAIEKREQQRKKAISKAYFGSKKKKKGRTLADELALTQKAFNRMRVLEEILWFKERGLEPECTSCGKKNMDWCCGHLKTVGAHPELRFDRKNSYLQCNFYCNKNLSGNISGNKTTRGYKQGLIDRFGEAEAKEIFSYCEQSTVKRWTAGELQEMRKEFNKTIRQLEKELNNDR